MKVKHGLGYQNYKDMMANHIFYIDKTNFIREWWEYADKVTLITRPRRFGKTLNLSTIECFLSNKYEGRSDLFEGRLVWEDENLRKLQGTFPVISLSFAGVKSGYDKSEADGNVLDNVGAMKTAVKQILSDVYAKFRDIMKSELFDENDRAYFSSVNDHMTDKTAQVAIRRLCSYLKRVYGKNVIVLLDEYDTPMQEAWVYGYWNHAVAFFRSFFVTTFKDNDSIERGLITGITRISKESIFSELNHLEVVTTLSDKYSTSFGFTEKEVFQVLDELNLSEHKAGVRKWYDGFIFGGCADIYNPWSIIEFISKKGEYAPYWANTSSNSLVSTLIQTGDADAKKTVEDLMKGKSFTAPIDEQIVFNQLDQDDSAVWSMLMASGYLKPEYAEFNPKTGMTEYILKLTNQEVYFMFHSMIKDWFGKCRQIHNAFLQALLSHDSEGMNEYMNDISSELFSSFDTGKKPSVKLQPERFHAVEATTKSLTRPNSSVCFYHGFVLGLIVELREKYYISSNKESGFGRYDIMIEPKEKEADAFIIEFKVVHAKNGETLETAVQAALKQIEEKKYDLLLRNRGISAERIRKYGFAFEGKKVLIG